MVAIPVFLLFGKRKTPIKEYWVSWGGDVALPPRLQHKWASKGLFGKMGGFVGACGIFRGPLGRESLVFQ